jgi:hypothetical protein
VISIISFRTLNLTPHTSHLTPHTSHLTPHTSHLTPHTSHLPPHPSHLTPHTSHLPPPPPTPGALRTSRSRMLCNVRNLRQVPVAPAPPRAHRLSLNTSICVHTAVCFASVCYNCNLTAKFQLLHAPPFQWTESSEDRSRTCF